ncbi:MAG: hypothetical protein HFJ55_05425 [Clostridia bacterium]|nr:hypothetical protein [Clostridia bacterium]
MEYFENILKKTGWSSLITSIIFAILGIVLITQPEATVKFISYIIGGTFILTGAYKILSYIYNKGKYDFYDYDMPFGIIAIILGIVTIVYSSQILAMFRIIIGLWITYSAIIRINLALKLKNINSNVWVHSLAIALIMLVCGIYILFNTAAIIVTIGVAILAYSILDIIESIIFLNNVNKI